MMKNFRQLLPALGLAAGLTATTAGAQVPTCNLVTPCGSTVACVGGCGSSISVYHASVSPCGSALPQASFDLTATEFATTCLTGVGCLIGLPPLRFWQYDAYAKANSGCIDTVAASTLANAALDFNIGPTPGHWFLYQGNWQNPAGDGCIAAASGELRTVAEISFPDRAREGTVDHRSFYLVASVDNAGDYDFDRLSGSTGCGPGDVPAVPVAGLAITGLAGSCTGSSVVTTYADNSRDGGYFDVPVTLTAPSPDYFTEAGKSPASKPLISGYQVLYAGGTGFDASSEPTSSDAVLGGWRVARDPLNPALAMGVVPYGTSTPIMVSIPLGSCDVGPPARCPWYWLATRIVYKDASENPTNAFDPAASGPLVVSDLSGHCGPVRGTGFVSVTWAEVKAERFSTGIRVAWSTYKEDDTLGFEVVRVSGPAGTETTTVLAEAIEARGALSPYEVIDREVAADARQSHGYYVQEITTSGTLGDRSPLVTVPGVAPPPDPADAGSSSGGRARRDRRLR